ncbi:MAG: hypothetical protein MZW92_38730 [Comamonadaceae bacterium]|nr:hypothetical protein [Comamonadaceae bacterium]
MPTPPILWYVADPMCSWCWGFAPVIEGIKAAYCERMKIALMLGACGPAAPSRCRPRCARRFCITGTR